MRSKETRIQGAKDVGLKASPRDIMDAVEDELMVIDREYRIRFANATMLGRFQERNESPIGRLCYRFFMTGTAHTASLYETVHFKMSLKGTV